MSYAEHLLGLRPGLYPFESRFREVAGAKIHYVVEGTGPAIVMIHGNPTWSFQFREVIRVLAPRWRCVALDLPGFGLSDPPARFGYRPEEHAVIIASFLADLGIENATLLAHDWGGPIGLAAAFAQPGRLTRFALGNSWAWPVDGTWHFEWFSRLMGGTVGELGAKTCTLFVNGVMPRAMRRGRLPGDVMRAYRTPFRDRSRRIGTWVFPREILQSRDFLHKLSLRLDEIDGRRVLFLWPDRDIAFRERELGHWQSIWPDAKIVRLHNCGHFIFEEAGGECAAALDDWLGGASDAAAPDAA